MNRPTRRKSRNSSSKFKGVYRDGNRWSASIFIGSKHHYIGCYGTEEDAARAYDEASLELVGPTAFQNMRDLAPRTEPIIDGSLARIPINDGTFVTIDIEDLERVNKHLWFRHLSLIYATIFERKIGLPRFLLGKPPKGYGFVHLNGDRSDFRRVNLAIVQLSLVLARSRKTSQYCTSAYKGVILKGSGWNAVIEKDGKRVNLGRFQSEIDAARAYDEAARQKYGLFAALNFPREGEVSCFTGQPVQRAA